MIWRVTLLLMVKHARVRDTDWLAHGNICSDHVRVWVAATVVVPINNAPGGNSGIRTFDLRWSCNVLMVTIHFTIKDVLTRHELTMRHLPMIGVLPLLDLKFDYRRLSITSLLVITLFVAFTATGIRFQLRFVFLGDIHILCFSSVIIKS